MDVTNDKAVVVQSADELREYVAAAIKSARQNPELLERPSDFFFEKQERQDCLRVLIDLDQQKLHVLYANKDLRSPAPYLKEAVESLKGIHGESFDVDLNNVYRSELLLSAQLGQPVHPPETDHPWHRIETISKQTLAAAKDHQLESEAVASSDMAASKTSHAEDTVSNEDANRPKPK